MRNTIEKDRRNFGPLEAIIVGIAAVALCTEIATCTDWVGNSIEAVLGESI